MDHTFSQENPNEIVMLGLEIIQVGEQIVLYFALAFTSLGQVKSYLQSLE